MSLLPASMKNIRSKMKALNGHNIYINILDAKGRITQESAVVYG